MDAQSDPDACVRILRQPGSQSAGGASRAADIRAIEVIDLEHEPMDGSEDVERWRTVVKGTCVWIQDESSPDHPCSRVLGVVQRIFWKDEAIHVTINWFWNLADVRKALLGASRKQAADELAGVSDAEVFYSMDKQDLNAACILHPAKVTFAERSRQMHQVLQTSRCTDTGSFECAGRSFFCNKLFVKDELRVYSFDTWGHVKSFGVEVLQIFLQEFAWLCKRSEALSALLSSQCHDMTYV
ncbi:hypothetical protein WJX74_003060 [Apatococcus lobatus]|uniref:BAH domain-containing protein n=2 Tax=Apatococcus TaxID=904362 RepID=A0AAW1SYV5_9CHLO